MKQTSLSLFSQHAEQAYLLNPLAVDSFSTQCSIDILALFLDNYSKQNSYIRPVFQGLLLTQYWSL